ncbi:MAG: hypothetical protein GXP06_05615 [Alphaproteobacteria bacterium]|nr:hypothetical protein [Alphaproteobacteria bacterium]
MPQTVEIKGDLKNDIIAITVSAVVAIIAFITSTKFGFLGQFEAFTFSILLLIAGERISYTLLRRKFETRLSQSNVALEGLLRSQIDSEVFPSAALAEQYVNEKIKTCTHIYDTKIRLGDNEQTDLDYYSTETHSAFREARKMFLAKGGVYHDIVSENISASSLRQVAEEVQSISPHGYRPYILKQNRIPFTNFMILHSPDGVEVLYGWAFSKHDIAPCVFMSRNKNLIRYFERQFQILEQCGEKVALPQTLNSDASQLPNNSQHPQ